ncbi:MAG TPA: hypothetical protein VGD37_29815 [Kofleriaceae bacterium]
MYGYDEELDAEHSEAVQDAIDGEYATSVMGGGPKSGVFRKPLNPGVEVPGRPVDDPTPEYEPEPPEMPPDPGPPPSQPPQPLEPPETYPDFDPEAVPEGPGPAEGGELLEDGETLLEGGETAAEGVELAEGGAALGELAPVAAAGIAGYEVGSAIAPYVYGDKNLDGSPVIKHENVDDIDANYKDSWAYKINQWLDD